MMLHGDAKWDTHGKRGAMGIILWGFFFFMPWMNIQAKRKKKHTWCLVFSFSVRFLPFSFFSIFSLSFFFLQIKKSARVLPLSPPFDQYISFFIFPIILIDIFLKKLVIQFREVKRGYCSLTHSHLSFLNF